MKLLDNLELQELENIYYCLGKTRMAEVKLISNEEIDKLMAKVWEKIEEIEK